MQADIILIGAGLSSSLLAWILLEKNPGIQLMVFEQNQNMPLDRTWSFHQGDVEPYFDIVKPLISKTWSEHSVRFQTYERTMGTSYCSIRPEDLEKKIKSRLGSHLQFNSKVRSFTPTEVSLEDGSVFTASCVIDARGPGKLAAECGFQKFLGLHLKLKKPHGLRGPIIMDATLAQVDGYRFMYALPWSETEILLEDTYYSNSPTLNLQHLEAEIRTYAKNQGWDIESVVSQEHGVLPIPLDYHLLAPPKGEVPCFGMRAGLYHPVTGYSLPDAVRGAVKIAELQEWKASSVNKVLDSYRQSRSWQWRYFCLLNRLMFQASSAEERYKIFERFYTLPQGLIGDFYKGHLSRFQQIRILSGRPPVPIGAAVRCLMKEGV